MSPELKAVLRRLSEAEARISALSRSSHYGAASRRADHIQRDAHDRANRHWVRSEVITGVAYSSGDKSKLAGIEALADVTDATNVAAAGAVLKDGLTEWDEQAGNSPTPASGKWRIYFKSSGVFVIDDAGTVTGPLASAGGGGGGDMVAATYDPGSVAGDAFDMDNMVEGTAKILTAAERTILGNTSGTNTGDQSSIVGISGTKAQFNTAATDGTFMFVGDAPTSHTHTKSEITDFVESDYATGAEGDLAASAVQPGDNISDLTNDSGFTDDQTGAEIKAAYEGEADTNAFTDAEKTLLGNQSGTNTGDESAASLTVSGVVELATIAETDTGTDATRAVTPAGLAGSALQAKVDGIESGATADQSDAEIKTAYENNADTNALTDAEKALLGNTSGTNTGDEPDASTTVKGIIEIATLAEVNTGTDATRAVTPDTLADSDLAAEVAANTLKDTNATHTGDVTGSEELTIADEAVTLAKMAHMATDSLLGRDTAGTGDVEVLSASSVRGILNVSDGATANDTDANLKNRDNHTGTQDLSTISDAGTAAALDVPAAGDAASGEVVKGNDTRLTDSRTPTSHNHNASEINAGTLADARVAESNVTQHEGALSLAKSQITDFTESDYATGAEGDLASSAVQPGDNVSDLTNDSGFTSTPEVMYGGMYANNSSGSTTITTGGTFYKMTQFDSSTATNGVTADPTTDNDLVIDSGNGGKYLINFSCSFTGASGNLATFRIYVDGSASVIRAKILGDGGVQHVAMSGILTLSASEAVTVYVTSADDADTITATEIQLSVTRVGT